MRLAGDAAVELGEREHHRAHVAQADEPGHPGQQPQLLAERLALGARAEPQRGARAVARRQHSAPGQEDAAQLLGEPVGQPARAALVVGHEVAVERVLRERPREDLGQPRHVALGRRADLELRHDPLVRAHTSDNDAGGQN